MTIENIMAYWPFILGAFATLAALVLLLRRRGQRVMLEPDASVVSPTLARVTLARPVLPNMDVAVSLPQAVGQPDDLRRIKGLGPKVAAQLGALGITRFDQLAALDAAAQTALDAQLGQFAGRMARDRWIDQAKLLSRGDIPAFEAQFGKLG